MSADPYLNTLIVAEYPGHRRFVASILWTEESAVVQMTDDERGAWVTTSTQGDDTVNRLHNLLHVWLDSGRTQASRTKLCPGVQYFATIGILRPFLATYRQAPIAPGRRAPKPRKPKTLGPYFARTYEGARRFAAEAIEREHDGAELLEVTMTIDPRD